jgi:hypothetical protein
LAADIEAQAGTAVVTGLDVDLVDRVLRRAFGHEIDHAAGRRTPIEHGRRALDHFHALEQVRVDLGQGVEIGGQAQAVEILVRLEAAQLDLVVAAGHVAAQLRHGAADIAQHRAYVAGLLFLDLVGRDHRHRLRRLDQRRVGLGCRARAFGDITLDRAGGGLDRGFGFDLDRGQRLAGGGAHFIGERGPAEQ